MMTTTYLDKEGKQDKSALVSSDYGKAIRSKKAKLTRILALLLTMITDESEEGLAAFEAVMVQFAMYMCCDGEIHLRASDYWYDVIAKAQSDLKAMLSPSDYDELDELSNSIIQEELR